MALGKENLKKIKKSLLRAWTIALGIEYLNLTTGTRQRLTPVAAVTHPAIFAEGQFAEG